MAPQRWGVIWATFLPQPLDFPPQIEGRLREVSRACAFHCPFALTFTCSLIFRRDNYRSDTLERSVIWGSLTIPVLPLLFPLGPSGSHHN